MIAEGIEFGRKQQELASRRGSAAPSLSTLTQISAPRIDRASSLRSGDAVEPREAHSFVVAESDPRGRAVASRIRIGRPRAG